MVPLEKEYMCAHTLLFVDDEKNILKSLSRLFFDDDYEILLAQSGKEALDMIDNGARPVVIVSDQQMPVMNGVEFLSQAKEKLPDSIRMILTGYADINAAMDAINRGGIYRYIMKPWNDGDLKLAVREAIARYELVQKNRDLTAELKEKNRALEDLNTTLEQKVLERTKELKNKVKELQARDRIQRHLMTIHPLHETLPLILETIDGVLDLDGVAVYLKDESQNSFSLSSFRCTEGKGLDFHSLEKERILAEKIKESLMAEGAITLENDEAAGQNLIFAFVPIHKGNTLFGGLVAGRIKPADGFMESELATMTSFAMQAATAVNDSKMSETIPDLETSLDDVLANFQVK